MEQSKHELINEMLFKDAEENWKFQEFPYGYQRHPWGFLVHASIIENFEKMWQKVFINTVLDIFEYTLQIGSNCYDMRMFVLPPRNEEKVKFLREFIKNSQFSFPWANNPTVFINLESFYILKQFIRIHNLDEYILKIDIKPGITGNDEIIKVVTFDQSVNTKFDVIKTYQNHFRSNESYHPPEYYYATLAFPWLHPFWLDHFKIPIDYRTYIVVHMILGTLNGTNELCIFDLVSIRMALYDFRDPTPQSFDVKSKIDFLIKRKLAKIVQNNHLDLDQYAIDKNVAHRELLVDYLIYEFQNNFETVKRARLLLVIPSLDHTQIACTVELTHESDILNMLKEKCNVIFDIDGRNYDRMTMSLFLEIAQFKNVQTIILDTNYIWVKDSNKIIFKSRIKLNLFLIGQNTYNFIEDFVSSLKRMTFYMSHVLLRIVCDLYDYRILNDLKVYQIELYSDKVDTHMLDGLLKCNLKSCIRIVGKSFENTYHNWALLNNIRAVNEAYIYEDEGIWQSLYEFIWNTLLKSNSKEFCFHKEHIWICGGSGGSKKESNIHLEQIKFTIDELKSKVELRHKHNNEIIDLYYLKFELKPDDKHDYDFYQ